MHVENTFGPWLRRQLARREMKQADFARRAGASPGMVSGWINCKRLPNHESADRIADALAVDRDDVLALVGIRPSDGLAPPDDQVTRIVSLLKRVDLDVGHRGDGLEDMLRRWIELDRKDRQALKGA